MTVVKTSIEEREDKEMLDENYIPSSQDNGHIHNILKSNFKKLGEKTAKYNQIKKYGGNKRGEMNEIENKYVIDRNTKSKS